MLPLGLDFALAMKKYSWLLLFAFPFLGMSQYSLSVEVQGVKSSFNLNRDLDLKMEFN